MNGKGDSRVTRQGLRFHQAAVCVAGAAILFAALTGPQCHCRFANAHQAELGRGELASQASTCDCSGTRREFGQVRSTSCNAESLGCFRPCCQEKSCPCTPCTCCDANPLVYAEFVTSSLKPISPSTQYSCLPPLRPTMTVLIRRRDGRGAVQFETPSKLCARLCRYLI